jgi:hypothetical protein
MVETAWLVDMGYVVKTAKKGFFKVDYVEAEGLLEEKYGEVKTFLFNGYDNKHGISQVESLILCN